MKCSANTLQCIFTLGRNLLCKNGQKSERVEHAPKYRRVKKKPIQMTADPAMLIRGRNALQMTNSLKHEIKACTRKAKVRIIVQVN